MWTNSVGTNSIERYLGRVGNRVQKNFEKLSSGRRINRASDDAAALSIAEKLRSLVSGMEMAVRNVDDGVSLANVAEGAMGSQSAMLTRMRELSIQSANGTLGPDERAALNAEFTALRDELDRVARTTQFNDMSLLEGANIQMQAGATADAASTISIGTSATTADALGLTSLSIDTQAGAQSSLDSLDSAIQTVSNNRGDVGAAVNRLYAARNNLSTAAFNMTASLSRLQDLDVASESAALARNSIQMRAAIAVHRQANDTKGLFVSLLR
ncbi:MAG: flagellin [Pseudomonadota bacterium]